MTTPTTTAVPSSQPADLLYNAEQFDAAMNGNAATYPDRFGVQRMTLAGAVDSIRAVNVRGAWASGATYAVKDVATSGGVAYIAIAPHIAGATFAGDLAAYWRVYQGVLSSDLAADSGAGLAGYKSADLAGAISTNLLIKTARDIDLTDVIPAAEWAAIRAGASSYNASDDINTALDDIADGCSLVLPFGVYPLSSALAMAGKSDVSILSRGAKFVSASAFTMLTLSGCARATLEGRLHLAGHAGATGLRNTGGSRARLSGVCASGLLVGVQLDAQATESIGGISVSPPSILDTARVTGCTTGVMVTGEYYEIAGAQIDRCTSYGARLQGGNIAVMGGQYIGNQVGIFREGGVVSNSDHGRIVGASINHSIACGIHIKDLQYAERIVGCDIWATIGDGAGGGFLAGSSPKNNNFGLYIENASNLSLTGNSIANNRVNCAVNGLALARFAGNVWISDSARTQAHYIEVGAANVAYGINGQITHHDTYQGAFASGFTARRNVETLRNTSSQAILVSGATDRAGIRSANLTSGSSNVDWTADLEKVFATDGFTGDLRLLPERWAATDNFVTVAILSAGTVKITLPGATGTIAKLISGDASISVDNTNKRFTVSASGIYRIVTTSDSGAAYCVRQSG